MIDDRFPLSVQELAAFAERGESPPDGNRVTMATVDGGSAGRGVLLVLQSYSCGTIIIVDSLGETTVLVLD